LDGSVIPALGLVSGFHGLAIGGLTFGLAALSKKFLEDPFLRFEPSQADRVDSFFSIPD